MRFDLRRFVRIFQNFPFKLSNNFLGILRESPERIYSWRSTEDVLLKRVRRRERTKNLQMSSLKRAVKRFIEAENELDATFNY